MQKVRQDLTNAEHQFSQLEKSIKDKQSAGTPVSESDYQKLYELDVQAPSTPQRIEAEGQGEGHAAGSVKPRETGVCCARK